MAVARPRARARAGSESGRPRPPVQGERFDSANGWRTTRWGRRRFKSYPAHLADKAGPRPNDLPTGAKPRAWEWDGAPGTAIDLYFCIAIGPHMQRDELLEAWQNNCDRPQWVRANREALEAHIDTSDPIPTSGTAAVAEWVDRYKGTVTRQLQADESEVAA